MGWSLGLLTLCLQRSLAFQPELCSACPYINVTASQQYTVSASARYLGVYLWGAGGSFTSHGAFVGGVLPVTGGEELGVIVGVSGSPGPSQGCGGGGNDAGSNGGGRSAIQEAAMM